MTARIDDQGRAEPPLAGSEVQSLTGFLSYQRSTLEWKTRGLSTAELGRAIDPTTMTLGGLLTHMAWVEDFWFGTVLAKAPPSEPWAGIDWQAHHDGDWELAATLEADEMRALWRQAVGQSEAIVDRALQHDGTLAETHPAWGGRDDVSLRWILLHMIEEYARHNGHADLLREAIDGETGE